MRHFNFVVAIPKAKHGYQLNTMNIKVSYFLLIFVACFCLFFHVIQSESSNFHHFYLPATNNENAHKNRFVKLHHFVVLIVSRLSRLIRYSMYFYFSSSFFVLSFQLLFVRLLQCSFVWRNAFHSNTCGNLAAW